MTPPEASPKVELRAAPLDLFESRALIARAAWRAWPYNAQSVSELAATARVIAGLTSGAFDPDRGPSVEELIGRLPSHAKILMELIALSHRPTNVETLIGVVGQNGSVDIQALNSDIAFLGTLADHSPSERAHQLLEHRLWSEAPPQPWLEGYSRLVTLWREEGREDELALLMRLVNGAESSAAAEATLADTGIPLWMLSDKPVGDEADDLFGFTDYARAIAAFITDPRTGTPLTLAINGPWGCGKSSLARLIQQSLSTTSAEGQVVPHITCWFNAWMHDDARDMAAAFASAIAQVADSHRSRFRRFFTPIPTSLLSGSRHTQRKVLRWSAGLIAVTAIAIFIMKYVQPSPDGVAVDLTDDRTKAIATMLIGFGGLMLQVIQKITESAKTVSEFVSDPSGAAQNGSLFHVERQLKALVRQATRNGRRRFVIFIDDVERCRPPRSVDLLEVVNQLLAQPDVVTIVLADLPAVAAAAEVKYKDVAASYGHGYGRLYLQKIIQLEFDIPAHRREAIVGFVTGVAREQDVAANSDEEGEPRLQRAPLGRRVRAWWRLARAGFGTGIGRWLRDLGGWALRRLEWVAALGTLLILAIVLPATVFPVPPKSLVVPFAVVAYFAVAVLVQARHSITNVMEARRAKRVRDLIDEHIARGVNSAVVMRRVLQDSGIEYQHIDQLVSERLIRNVTAKESEVWQAAVQESMRWVPLYPRHAKRLVNRMRLMLGIAFNRGGFADNPHLGAKAVGKWVVLWERWPEVAQRILRDPDHIGELEAAVLVKDGSFEKLIASTFDLYASDEDLPLLFASEPKLAPLIDRIVHLGNPAVSAS